MQRFLDAVAKFRAWAATFPGRHGEWEYHYPQWHEIYTAFAELAGSDVATWSQVLVDEVLYAIARDNEGETLVEELAPPALALLAEAALTRGERDARWQLAAHLDAVDPPVRDALLARLAEDSDAYVRLRAIETRERLR